MDITQIVTFINDLNNKVSVLATKNELEDVNTKLNDLIRHFLHLLENANARINALERKIQDFDDRINKAESNISILHASRKPGLYPPGF